ncbi:methyltransferase domain-containing protein [Mycolicibacterium moriokaense]|nr:methyltransferase domain-containing protein [Mycolicibacterium moriokaense]
MVQGGDDVDATHYVIRGGLEGRERLRLLARVMGPTTRALLDRVRLAPSSRCLDVGCGGGDVTTALARSAPDGFVVGTDMDATKLDVARKEAAEAGLTNIDYRVADVLDPPADGDLYDLVHARFLLTHLADPSLALTQMCASLAPGGTLVVVDIDCAGHFCYPDNLAFGRYVQLYTDVARARGCDPDIGRRLPSLVRATGLTDIQMNVVQPAGFDGEVKMMAPITLEAIADAVIAEGLDTADQLAHMVDELYSFAADDESVMSMPRVMQVWARKPA